MANFFYLIILTGTLSFSAFAEETPAREPSTTSNKSGDKAGDKKNLSSSVASEMQSSHPIEDAAEAAKAQKRLYPGGRDEQDIKVQASLPQPARSLDGGPIPGEAEADPDHD